MNGPRTPLGLKYQLERERRPFQPSELRRLERNRPGVYALWLPDGGPDECLYAGMSAVCLRRRLLQHLNHETNPELRRLLQLYRDIVEFSTACTAPGDETLALEDAIIRSWQPAANRRGIERTGAKK